MKKGCFVEMLMLLLLAANFVTAGWTIEIIGEVKLAALEEDWPRVAELCSDESQLKGYPVLRLILGHAFLALNRNDESLELFTSIKEADDISALEAWSTALLEEHPDNPMALYFRGDAQARAGDWESAASFYSESIEASKKAQRDNPLAHNARGVARVFLGDLGGALEDFESAGTAKEDFADAFANAGTMLIIREAGKGALDKYNLALEKSESFALAHNGRGCARLGCSRKENTMEDALHDFGIALKCLQTKDLAQDNITMLGRAYVSETTGNESSAETGTTMKVSAQDVKNVLETRGLDAAQNMVMSLSPTDRTRVVKEANFGAMAHGVGAFFSGEKGSASVGAGVNVLDTGANFNLAAQSDPTARFDMHSSHAKSFESVAALATSDSAGNLLNPGGGDTSGTALDKSVGDIGPWPVKNTWFGLFPAAILPTQ